MDQQASDRWLETLKKEQRSKNKWENKYLTEEQKQREAAEQEAVYAQYMASSAPRRANSERDAMEMRLAAFDNEVDPPKEVIVNPAMEVTRERIAAEVAAARQRSHRFTGDLSTESMLGDIGPGLWSSINPMYAPMKPRCTSYDAHSYDKSKGWGEKVDKQHHNKMDDFMKHAEKCLELGEKPFVSGGMKKSG